MPQLRAGSASRNITPAKSLPFGGAGPYDNWSEGTHDPLRSTAAVVSDGETTVAIVSVDLLNVYRAFTADVREAVASKVPVDDVLLAATHTHSAPYMPAPLWENVPFFLDSLGFTEETVADAVTEIRRGVVESVVAAHEAMVPATLRVGRAENRDTPINRRGVGGTRGDIGNPVTDSTDIDPNVLVCYLSPDGRDDIAVFNAALHPTPDFEDQGARFSASWPAVVYDRVHAARGNVATLFLNGAAGDVSPHRYDTGRYRSAEVVGDEMATTVLEALAAAESAPERTDATVRSKCCDVRFPLKEINRPELERRLHELETEIERAGLPRTLKGSLDRNRGTRERLYTQMDLAADEWAIDALTASVQYVEFGDVGVVSLPGEGFVRHGFALRDAADARSLLIAGYANEYVGYIPTTDELDRGGYEVRTSMLAREGIQRMYEVGEELVRGG